LNNFSEGHNHPVITRVGRLTELTAKWKQRTFEDVEPKKVMDRYLCDLGAQPAFHPLATGGETVETWSWLLTSIYCPSSE